MIHEVRAHVAERALAPVDPAAPVERVIQRVILDIGAAPRNRSQRRPLGTPPFTLLVKALARRWFTPLLLQLSVFQSPSNFFGRGTP
jgi:hypothetical protein